MNACQKRIEELLAEPPATEKKAPERDAHGRFAAGNSGGPGNPFGRYTAMLREAMISVVTEEDMQAIVRKMIDMARAGSIPAMRLVLQYVIGKPTAAVNPDRVDVDEWNVHKETAAMTDDVSKVVKSLEPEACLDMARNVRPIMSDVALEKCAKEFAAPRENPPQPQPLSPEPAADGFDGGKSNAPHPQPLSPQYRGEGRTDGRSVLPERTFDRESTLPPHGFDGGESNAPHPPTPLPGVPGRGANGR